MQVSMLLLTRLSECWSEQSNLTTLASDLGQMDLLLKQLETERPEVNDSGLKMQYYIVLNVIPGLYITSQEWE